MFIKGQCIGYSCFEMRSKQVWKKTKVFSSKFVLSCFAATFINAVSFNSNVGSVYLRTNIFLAR